MKKNDDLFLDEDVKKVFMDELDAYTKLREDFDQVGEDWNKFTERDNENVQFKAWKKPADNGMLKIKMWFILKGVTDEMIMELHRDTEFRRDYDDFTSEMSVVKSQDYREGEYDDVLYWRMKIPILPFIADRDYLFKRFTRKIGDCWLSYEKAIEDDIKPVKKKYVRIEEYEKIQITRQLEGDRVEVFINYIKPLDLKMKLPLILINWLASTGSNLFVDKLRKCLIDFKAWKVEHNFQKYEAPPKKKKKHHDHDKKHHDHEKKHHDHDHEKKHHEHEIKSESESHEKKDKKSKTGRDNNSDKIEKTESKLSKSGRESTKDKIEKKKKRNS